MFLCAAQLHEAQLGAPTNSSYKWVGGPTTGAEERRRAKGGGAGKGE